MIQLTENTIYLSLPDGVMNVKLIKWGKYWQISYDYPTGHDYTSGGFALFYKDFGGKKFYPEKLELIFTTSTIDEEKAKMVVRQYGLCHWADYGNGDNPFYDNPVSSFQSLLKSKSLDTNGNYAILKKV